MRIILDEGVPKQVARHLSAHEVMSVPDAGWASVKNGALLGLIEQSIFEVFVTCDKNIEYQQHQLNRKPFGVLILSTNHWPSMQSHMARVAEAVGQCIPGTITEVDCGHFVPRKLRKPSGLT